MIQWLSILGDSDVRWTAEVRIWDFGGSGRVNECVFHFKANMIAAVMRWNTFGEEVMREAIGEKKWKVATGMIDSGHQ